jgi:hypothetical protein
MRGDLVIRCRNKEGERGNQGCIHRRGCMRSLDSWYRNTHREIVGGTRCRDPRGDSSRGGAYRGHSSRNVLDYDLWVGCVAETDVERGSRTCVRRRLDTPLVHENGLSARTDQGMKIELRGFELPRGDLTAMTGSRNVSRLE